MSIRGKDYEMSSNYTGMKNENGSKTEMMEYRVKFDKYYEYGMERMNIKAGST